MSALLLSDDHQAAVRAVIGAGLVSGEHVLEHLARLIHCDDTGIAVVDGAGRSVVGEAAGPGWTTHAPLPWSPGSAVLGIHHRHRAPRDDCPGRRGAAVLSLGVPVGGQRVVTLWLVRRASDFSARDRALLGLVAPALERVLREPSTAALALLTAQERRVLQHVAVGLSNAEIAERLVVAPCTVRKHLENAYRKLGVSNRVAAVHALTGGGSGQSQPVMA